MGIGDNSAALLFRIKGDASDAVRAFNQTKTAQGDLVTSTSGLTGALTGLINPVTAVTGGVTAIATAAVATGAALLNLAKSAAEYGSEIFDATQKTGLSAEAISALKYAAEQSGSSFEAITGAVSKFNVVLGQAQNGNEKAEATLKQYGITARTTDEALIQAVSTIGKMTDSAQQAAAAQALFRDRSGEILPVIKSFDGDLTALISRLREMGLLMSDEDARAADEFGDQMSDLNRQIEAVGRTIGLALLPTLRELAKDFSDFLTRNQSEIKAWGKLIADQVNIAIEKIYILRSLLTAAGKAAVGDFLGAQLQLELIPGILADRRIRNRVGVAGGTRVQGGDTFPTAPGPRGRDGGADEADRARREQEKAEAARLAAIQRRIRQQIQEEAAKNDTLNAQDEQRLREGMITEEQYLKFRQDRVLEFLGFRMARLLEEKEAFRGNKEEEKRIQSEINVLNFQIEEELHKQRIENYDQVEKRLERQRELWEGITEAITKGYEEAISATETLLELEADRENRRLENRRERRTGTGVEGDVGIDEWADIMADLREQFDLVSIFSIDEEGQTVIKDSAEFIRDVWSSVSEDIAGALSTVVSGLANMAAAWLATGEFSAAAALKMAAGVALSLAMQSAIKAIFEAAEAVAAAARWDFVAAGLHSAAASMYATVAVVAGAIGVGLGLAARAVGGGSKGRATASAGSANSRPTAQNNVSGQGQAYSGKKEYTIDESRNQPGLGAIGVQVDISFKDKPHWFEEMFDANWKVNGKIRRRIEDGR